MSIYFKRSLIKAAIWYSLIVIAWAIAVSHEGTPAVRPDVAGSPEAVLDRMGDECWTGTAPEGVKIPGRVIYQLPNDGAKVGGPKMVHKALEQLFEDVDHNMEVIAFCR